MGRYVIKSEAIAKSVNAIRKELCAYAKSSKVSKETIEVLLKAVQKRPELFRNIPEFQDLLEVLAKEERSESNQACDALRERNRLRDELWEVQYFGNAHEQAIWNFEARNNRKELKHFSKRMAKDIFDCFRNFEFEIVESYSSEDEEEDLILAYKSEDETSDYYLESAAEGEDEKSLAMANDNSFNFDWIIESIERKKSNLSPYAVQARKAADKELQEIADFISANPEYCEPSEKAKQYIALNKLARAEYTFNPEKIEKALAQAKEACKKAEVAKTAADEALEAVRKLAGVEF